MEVGWLQETRVKATVHELMLIDSTVHRFSEQPKSQGRDTRLTIRHAWAYQHIVWLDICMKHAAPLEQLQGQQELLGVRANSLDMQSNVLPIFLQHFSKVHAR